MSRPEIEKEAKDIEEAAKYSSETQFEYAKTWRRIDRILAAIGALLAAVAGAGFLSDLLGVTAAGLVALIAAAFGAVSASMNAPQTKEKAAGSANLYRALQQDARVFRRVILPTISDEEALEQLLVLVKRHQELSGTAEIPSSRAWKRAKKQIETGSQHYESDD